MEGGEQQNATRVALAAISRERRRRRLTVWQRVQDSANAAKTKGPHGAFKQSDWTPGGS